MKTGNRDILRCGVFILMLWTVLVFSGCATTGEQVGGESPKSIAGPLVDTRWRLIEFQSMDDATGTKRPEDPNRYTMSLNGDGTVAMQLNCSSVTGRWSAGEVAGSGSGGFEFRQLKVERSRCPSSDIEKLILSQAGYIRSWMLKDGRLFLSLMADGGIFAWEP
jgi:hypothetical protein